MLQNRCLGLGCVCVHEYSGAHRCASSNSNSIDKTAFVVSLRHTYISAVRAEIVYMQLQRYVHVYYSFTPLSFSIRISRWQATVSKESVDRNNARVSIFGNVDVTNGQRTEANCDDETEESGSVDQTRIYDTCICELDDFYGYTACAYKEELTYTPRS
jgi:hypothetical protein